MNIKTFKKICDAKNLNSEDVLYNCGYDINELRLHKGEIFKPCFYIGGKPKYEYIAKYEVILEDCI